MQRFSDQYWDAYLNLGDRAKVRKLRYYTGAIYNNLREMAEELAILKDEYRRQWLAENRPYWLESVLARYDQMISIWLTKSRAMDEALRKYEDDFDVARTGERLAWGLDRSRRTPIVSEELSADYADYWSQYRER